MSLDPQFLEILRCPACRSELDEVDEELVCRGCGHHYPIRDGIPVLLPPDESATPPPDQEAAAES